MNPEANEQKKSVNLPNNQSNTENDTNLKKYFDGIIRQQSSKAMHRIKTLGLLEPAVLTDIKSGYIQISNAQGSI